MGSLIHYTTNPGEYDDLEGVVVSEQVPAGFIAGADRNGTIVVGRTLKGPVGVAVQIGSEQEFEDIFGHYTRPNSSTVVNEVRQYLLSKPFANPLVVVRAAAAAAATAEADFDDITPTAIINIAASSPGAWGADLTAAITAATDGDADHFNLTIAYRGKSITYANLDTTTGNDNLLATIGNGNDVLVTVTKLADGRPLNIAATALTDTAGADGTIADSDYTVASTGPLAVAAGYPGVSAVSSADRNTPAIKAAIAVLAAAAVDRMFIIWSGTHGDAVATVAADAATYRSDRIVYCYNSPYILDPEFGTEIQVPPHSFMGSIFSQTDVNWSVSSGRTVKSTAAIRRLTRTLSRADLITLKNAGVCALESQKSGFRFRSPVTTSLTPGLTEISRRRCADFLQLSVAERLQDFVEEEDTETVNAQIIAEIDAFCADLRDQGRVIANYSITGEATRVDGVKILKWRVDLIKHLKSIVLETEIGTGLTIEVAEAA